MCNEVPTSTEQRTLLAFFVILVTIPTLLLWDDTVGFCMTLPLTLFVWAVAVVNWNTTSPGSEREWHDYR